MNKLVLGTKLIACSLFLLSESQAQVTAVKYTDDAIEVVKIATRSGKIAKGLGRIAGALKDDEIIDLAAKSQKVGGLEEVGQILGKRNLGDSVLEDTFLRMAVKNRRLDEDAAKKAFTELSGTPGLRTLARKINSVNGLQAKGHIQELMVGLRAKERGLDVVEFGKRFDDGIKNAATDIDLVLRSRGKSLAVESKAWSSDVPMDMIRKDADSLSVFCRVSKDTKPVFCFETSPSLIVRKELTRRAIDLVEGTPDEIAAQLEWLIKL